MQAILTKIANQFLLKNNSNQKCKRISVKKYDN